MEVKILNGRTHFYQWDSEQKFIVDDANVNELHFTNNAQEDASVVSCYEQEGIKLCDIPNSYLEKNGILTVYAFTYENGNYTKNTFRFNVIERPKPNDYVIEEEDINRWGELDNKINVTKDELENEINLVDNKLGQEVEELEGKINTKSNEGHKHEIADVKELQLKLDRKADKTVTENLVSTTVNLQNQIYKKAEKEHTHSTDDVANLKTILNNIWESLGKKASMIHSHAISDISSLQYHLDNKANKGHNHNDVYYNKTEIDNSHYKKTEVDDLMKNATVSDEKIASSVEKYLEENPIEGGASSWNDLEDRPFYEEEKVGELAHEETYEFTFRYISDVDLSWLKDLKNGATYQVDWNGTIYNSKFVMIKAVEGENIGELYVLGNMAQINSGDNYYEGYEDTGEPFRFDFVIMNGEIIQQRVYKLGSDEETINATIKELIAEIVPIPTKYLPEHLQFGSNENIIAQEGEYTVPEDNPVFSFIDITFDKNLPVKVKYNGTEYECSCEDVEIDPGEFTTCFGNLSVVSTNPDTGEPFIGVYAEMDGICGVMLMPLDGSTSATIRIWQCEFKKLDAKFIDAEWMATPKKGLGEVIHEETYEIANTYTDVDLSWFDKLKVGEMYQVNWNGTIYNCKFNKLEQKANDNLIVAYYLGNESVVSTNPDTGEPFAFGKIYGNGNLLEQEIQIFDGYKGTVVATVRKIVDKFEPIPNKYLSFIKGEKNYLIPEMMTVKENEEEPDSPMMGYGEVTSLDMNSPLYVDINGTVYETKFTQVEIDAGVFVTAFGNVDFMSGGDNGQPFIGEVAEDTDENGNTIYRIVLMPIYEQTESIPVSAWQEQEKIDEKYLPTSKGLDIENCMANPMDYIIMPNQDFVAKEDGVIMMQIQQNVSDVVALELQFVIVEPGVSTTYVPIKTIENLNPSKYTVADFVQVYKGSTYRYTIHSDRELTLGVDYAVMYVPHKYE